MSINGENSQIDDYEPLHVINFDNNRKICIVGINKLTGHKHFIKIMKCDDVLNENEILREITIMDKLKHENIMSMKISSIERRNRKSFANFLNHEQIECLPEGETNYLFVSLEYCSHGNLKKWLEMNRVLVSKKENVGIIQQIICALRYLKSKNLIHRDVQAKSIFVDEKNVIKIGNFKSVSYLKENEVDSCFDENFYVYELGLIYLNLICPDLLKEEIEDAKNATFTERLNQDFSSEIELIKMMLEKNPSKRITLKSLDEKLIELSDYFSTFGEIKTKGGLIPYDWPDSDDKNYDSFCINEKSHAMFDFIKKDPETLKNVNSVIRKFTKTIVESDKTSLMDIIRNKQFDEEEIFKIVEESGTLIPKYEEDSDLD